MDGNKVLFGLKNVHVHPLTDAVAGTYGTAIPWPGAVKIALSPEGEEMKFYADDSVYYAQNSNNGFSGDWESAKIPAEVETKILGYLVDDTNGIRVERADAPVVPFAMTFEVMGDKMKRRYVLYNVIMGRPNIEYDTKGESVEVKTVTAPLTVMPIQYKDNYITSGHIEPNETNAEIFDEFLTSVKMPDAAVGA